MGMRCIQGMVSNRNQSPVVFPQVTMIFSPLFARNYWKKRVGVSFLCPLNIKIHVLNCVVEREEENCAESFTHKT